MKSEAIRESFLKYFEARGHKRVTSSSLIPASDPTLLFTNAGMVQFKDAFLGTGTQDYKRATTSQKCVRAGGKHNDLENVGFTPRHHTFFEMLGNFSFGDYFKKDAIAFAWELLTQEWKIPKDRLRITVFETDDEAYDLWKGMGVPEKWITRLGEKDNFWAMGDTGPCGPCSEIHYDWGEKPGCGDNPGNDTTGRFLEIWNLVFMQYNRDSMGKMEPLPKPSVDTGSGLERVSCVLQGVHSNYDTDLFQPILKAIALKVGQSYGKDEKASTSMRVVADHLRAGVFLIADGVLPSNEGRGYVLRRILRRAIRHGKKLGQENPFIYELADTVIQMMGKVYPELVRQSALIKDTLKDEETKFHQTLHRGLGVLEEAITSAKSQKANTLSGEVAFKLYDTYGFPLDLTQTIAAENHLVVDEGEFEKHMNKQRESSGVGKASSSTAFDGIQKAVLTLPGATDFLGYEGLTAKSKLIALFDKDGHAVEKLGSGSGYAVFDKTPFYAEGGGQAGDIGSLLEGKNHFKILNTTKVARHFLHHLEGVSGELARGNSYELFVDPKARQRTAINHTCTHLLHAALRKVLGDRVKQAGSLVQPDKLRFDFNHSKSVTAEEIEKIESIVNESIQAGLSVQVSEMPYAEAIKAGALAFFDEKYGDKVRVVRVGGNADAVSVELCGGTHLKNLSTAQYFKITSESSVASGVRRIEAITEQSALDYLREKAKTLELVERTLATQDVVSKVQTLQMEVKRLQKENERLQFLAAQAGGSNEQSGGLKPREHKGIQLVTEKLSGVSAKVLRELIDQARDKIKTKAVVALATESEGKVTLCLGISKDLVGTLHAGQLIQEMAKTLGGSGGGKPDFAQAGGMDVSKVPLAFETLEKSLPQV